MIIKISKILSADTKNLAVLDGFFKDFVGKVWCFIPHYAPWEHDIDNQWTLAVAVLGEPGMKECSQGSFSRFRTCDEARDASYRMNEIIFGYSPETSYAIMEDTMDRQEALTMIMVAGHG